MAAHSGARRCALVLLTLLLLSLGAAPASHALATSRPAERAAVHSDAILLHDSATATHRPLVHRSGAFGALPRAVRVAAPAVRDAAAPLDDGPELAQARQFDHWIEERGPPVSS